MPYHNQELPIVHQVVAGAAGMIEKQQAASVNFASLEDMVASNGAQHEWFIGPKAVRFIMLHHHHQS